MSVAVYGDGIKANDTVQTCKNLCNHSAPNNKIGTNFAYQYLI